MADPNRSAYRRRVVDDELDVFLEELPAISLEGPRAVGKTWTARRRARAVHNLDDPQTLALVEADPGRLTRGPEPIFIDEWQRYPPAWDLVRRAVDDSPRTGRFLLAGSTAPDTPPTHSGAGRIVALRMRPMSLFERGPSEPTVSLRRLLAGERDAIDGETDTTLERYVEEIVTGGLPGWRSTRARIQQAALDGYLHRAVDHDVPLMGYRARQPGVVRRWLTAYAAATATTATYETIRDAATAGEGDKPAKTTTTAYRNLLEAMWMVEPLPAWWSVANPLSRLKRGPKHHLADPALAARLLDVSAEDLLAGRSHGPRPPRDGLLLGALFESLVALNVRVYAQAAQARVSHLQTWNDSREVDLIVEKGRRMVALEVKLVATPRREDTRHLRWLTDRMGAGVADAVLVTTGRHAYRDRDGIAVVPAALLGP
ncbi:MAG: ATP-binding protein [Acidobacteria bacterium]|nr:ATP-binding protein [Acidobacteriota bacterium]